MGTGQALSSTTNSVSAAGDHSQRHCRTDASCRQQTLLILLCRDHFSPRDLVMKTWTGLLAFARLLIYGIRRWGRKG